MSAVGLLAVEDFLRLPDPAEGHQELHHGEVVVMPPPKRGHQKIQNRLQVLLQGLLGDHDVVHMEMAFRPGEHEVWVADVGCVLAKRMASTADDEYLMGAPEIVVEVLSPANTVDEMNDKMTICMENGCHSFWMVDPKRRVVSVTQGVITTHYGIEGSVKIAEPVIEVRVKELFV